VPFNGIVLIKEKMITERIKSTFEEPKHFRVGALWFSCDVRASDKLS
jgi:hypothetical protein